MTEEDKRIILKYKKEFDDGYGYWAVGRTHGTFVAENVFYARHPILKKIISHKIISKIIRWYCFSSIMTWYFYFRGVR